MKLYFLVEGVSSEMLAYPEWINAIAPLFNRHVNYTDFVESTSGFYIVSGYGYPSILNHIRDAIDNIIETRDVEHFFVILDADEDSVEQREREVYDEISRCNIPRETQVHVIVQNRCFETILLANRKIIPRQATSMPLVTYKRYFDVVVNDPEIMGEFDSRRFTHSQFHSEYARKALMEKRIRYSKSDPSSISNQAFIVEVIKRTEETEHLRTFNKFVEKLRQINNDYEKAVL